MKAVLVSLYLGCFAPVLYAQPALTAYIRLAFETNAGLRQQQFLLQRNLYALDEARRLFRPSVSFGTTYTRAAGGRTVDLPLGDLLNPVYATLNKLTETRAFPQVSNQRVLLNPNNFYDVRVRTTMPLINAEIGYGQRIKRQQYDLQQIEIALYKRELAKDIKTGYYRFLQASEAIRIYENALELVRENGRINLVLFNNQKVNRTGVVRSANEVTKIESQLEVARQTQQSAQAYLNFLINRPVYTDITADIIDAVPDEATMETDTAVAGREELAKLRQAQAINANLVGLAQTYRRPKLSAFLDLGSQGFDFRVNRNTSYFFGGLSFDWSLFAGGRNALRVKQAEYDGLAIGANTDYVTQQLRLQLTTTVNAQRSALSQYRAALSQLTASQTYYRDVQRLYKEGQVLYIELLDGQNQLINDQLQVSINRFDVWIRQAEVERATASLALD